MTKPVKTPSVPEIRCSHARLVATEKLKPNPANPNTHAPAQLDLYAKILRHQGWRRAVVVSKESGLIVTGHGAWLTAKKEGWPTCPVDVQSFKSRADEMAHMIADNKLPQLAEFDEEALAKAIKSELDGDYDLDLTGFNLEELQGLKIAPEPAEEKPIDTSAENLKKLQKKWKTALGQLWELGEHRVLCGDCRRDSALSDLFADDEPGMIFSDAPYGISIVSCGQTGGLNSGKGIAVGPKFRGGNKPFGKIGGNKPFGKIGGNKPFGKIGGNKPIIVANSYPPVIGDDDGMTARSAFQKLFVRFPKAIHVWWGANHFSDVLPPSSCWIVWDKENGDSFFADAELAFCSAKSAVRIFRHQWNGLMKGSERGQKRVHPTQKPIALAQWCIENYGGNLGSVLDPFLGSGTTLIACENLKRRCRGIEISPAYIAVILERWSTHTGKTPKLLSK